VFIVASRAYPATPRTEERLLRIPLLMEKQRIRQQFHSTV
jgi:hypothetical protein